MGYERVKHSHQVGEKHPARNWTLEIMAGAIVAIRESGKPINAEYLNKHYSRLYGAIKNQPGGWKKIVGEAGYDPAQETRVHLRGKRYGTSESSPLY